MHGNLYVCIDMNWFLLSYVTCTISIFQRLKHVRQVLESYCLRSWGDWFLFIYLFFAPYVLPNCTKHFWWFTEIQTYAGEGERTLRRRKSSQPVSSKTSIFHRLVSHLTWFLLHIHEVSADSPSTENWRRKSVTPLCLFPLDFLFPLHPSRALGRFSTSAEKLHHLPLTYQLPPAAPCLSMSTTHLHGISLLVRLAVFLPFVFRALCRRLQRWHQ